MDPRSKLNTIFWGLLFTILDIKINSFDLLPDFIGYAMISVGCSALLPYSKQFLLAKNFAFIMAVFAIANYFITLDFLRLHGFLYMVLDVAMVWFLLGAIMDVAQRQGVDQLHRSASNRRIAYLVSMCLVASIGSVSLISPKIIALYSIMLVIMILLVLCLILHVVHRAKHELSFDQ